MRQKGKIPNGGIGTSAKSSAAGFVQLKLINRLDPSLSIHIKELIVPRISSKLLDSSFSLTFDAELLPEQLVDPLCNRPGNIDLLLGVGAWAEIVREPMKRKIQDGLHVMAQLTIFGWVIYGQMARCSHMRLRSCHVSADSEDIRLDKLLLQFWEADSLPQQHELTPGEQRAEVAY